MHTSVVSETHYETMMITDHTSLQKSCQNKFDEGCKQLEAFRQKVKQSTGEGDAAEQPPKPAA